MECNKDEAIRAKDIAETKMQNMDFNGARKIALKAQHLYPGLECISQMLCVCDVHCSAEKKLSGNEMDWYGILQVEHIANEATIKKQYRKFALQLHPDKNMFPGAEAAFKLIGEAQSVLLDKKNRSLYDIKSGVAVSKPAPHFQPPQRPNSGTNFGFQSSHIRSNFTDVNLPFQQQPHAVPQHGSYDGRPTFWTACPICNVEYQSYTEVKNKSISCQTCEKFFTPSMHVSSTTPNLKVAPFPQKKDALPKHTSKVELKYQGNFSAGSSGNEFCPKKVPVAPFPQKKDALPKHTSKGELKYQGNFSAGSSGNEFCPKKGPTPEFRAEKANGKRQRKSEESDESCDTENSTDTKDMAVYEDRDFKAGLNSVGKRQVTRRSVRHKPQVSYKENLCDDDFVSHPKVSKGSQSSFTHYEDTENGLRSRQEKQTGTFQMQRIRMRSKRNKVQAAYPMTRRKPRPRKSLEVNSWQKSSETCVESPAEPDGDDYPHPDFNDFDKIRNKERFSVGQREGVPKDSFELDPLSLPKNIEETTVEGCGLNDEALEIPEPEFFDFYGAKSPETLQVGQVWALYCDEDGLPKYYALIETIDSNKFEVRINWLTVRRPSRCIALWNDKAIPVCCGIFKVQSSPMSYTDTNAFSHRVSVKRSNNSLYYISPKKGEIWALYRNWPTEIKLADLENCEYDIVEVVEEARLHCRVAFLERDRDFKAVFKPLMKDGAAVTVDVIRLDFTRFSHQMPAFRFKDERGGLLWEVDPAALPSSLLSP